MWKITQPTSGVTVFELIGFGNSHTVRCENLDMENEDLSWHLTTESISIRDYASIAEMRLRFAVTLLLKLIQLIGQFYFSEKQELHSSG